MIATAYIFAQSASDAMSGIVGGTDARALIVGLLTGVAFGAILQRVGASSFEMIVNMLRLKNLTIMKFMFLAIAVAAVGMYVVNQFWPDQAHIGIAPLYLGGLIVGGVIFGIGWAVAGYCPGTALVAMAEGKLDAAITVLGGLVGAFVLTLIWDPVKSAFVDPLNYGSKSLPDIIGAKPLLVAIVFAVLAVIFIMWLDHRGKGEAAEPGGRHGLLER